MTWVLYVLFMAEDRTLQHIAEKKFFETEQACIDSGCELGCDDMSPADNAWICEACNQGTTPESVQHLCGCCKKGTSTLRGKDVNALQKRAGLK